MAWLATDNAESYSNGNAISGLNGGTDWSGAWSVAGSGTKDIINTPTLEGSLCFRLDKVGSVEPEVLRSFANTTSGSLSFIVRATSNTKHALFCGFDETTTGKFSVGVDGGNALGSGAGHIVAYGATVVSLGAFSANTNYTIVVEYDNATDQFRASMDGGSTFSSYVSYLSVATNLTRIRWRILSSDSSNTDYYFDDIKPYSAVVGPANMKTYDGLASASVKTMDGLAIASVKTFNGLN